MTLPPTRACCSRVRPLGLSVLCRSVYHTLETDPALQPAPRPLPTQYGEGWGKVASSHGAVLPFLTIALVTWLWCPWGVLIKGNRAEETVAHPRCWQATLGLVSWNGRYPDLSYLPLCLWAGPHYELPWQDRCQCHVHGMRSIVQQPSTGTPNPWFSRGHYVAVGKSESPRHKKYMGP